MVIDYLDVMGVAVLPDEADAPLVIDADAPLIRSVSAELLEPIAWRDAEVAERRGRVEHSELAEAGPLHPGSPPPYRPPAEHPFGVLVAEAPDHCGILTHGVTIVKLQEQSPKIESQRFLGVRKESPSGPCSKPKGKEEK